MPCIHSIQRNDSGPFNPCKTCSQRCRKRGERATYKRGREGVLLGHGNERPQGRSYYLEIKACVGLEGVHLGGAIPFFDSSSANFPLCDAGVHDDIARGA